MGVIWWWRERLREIEERNFNSKIENQKERYGSDLMMQREKKKLTELNSNKRDIYIYIYI